jgi:hypothetical protein
MSWSADLLQWCSDCFWGTYRYYEETHYVQYCQDGRVWDDWWEVTADYYYDDWSWDCEYLCWI